MEKLTTSSVFVDFVLTACKTSQDAINFIHDNGMREWEDALETAYKPSKDQILVLIKVMDIIGFKLTHSEHADLDVAEKQMVLLCITNSSERFLKALLDLVNMLSGFQSNFQLWIKLLTNIHLFCEAIVKKLPYFLSDLMKLIIATCTERMVKRSGFATQFPDIAKRYVILQQLINLIFGPCELPIRTKSKAKKVPDKIKLPCGHVTVANKVSSKPSNCQELVEKQLSCGHKQLVKCSAPVSEADCKALVTGLLPGFEHQNIKYSKKAIPKCQSKCSTPLPCGHSCRLTCRTEKDPDHLKYQCKEPCGRFCESGHPCQNTHECFKECSPCLVTMKEVLICGHEQEVSCCSRGTGRNVKCIEKVNAILKCGHEQLITCGMDPASHHCTFWIEKCERKCMQGHTCASAHPCYKKCRTCDTTVGRVLKCGHVIMVSCSEDESIIKCTEKTRKRCKLCLITVTIKCQDEICKDCKGLQYSKPLNVLGAKKPGNTDKRIDAKAGNGNRRIYPSKSDIKERGRNRKTKRA